MTKKSCRRTMDENKIHEKAVKMRKKTDEQLVHYVEDRVEKARSEGFNEGKALAKNTAKEFIVLLQQNKIPGIGAVTINKLVLETLKAFTCENIAMNFLGPKMPAVVEAEDSDMKAIVLPVMIREE